jgi:hypothetical protein
MIPLLRLDDKFPVLSFKTLALARHTVAEPVANWARLSLPVLIIGQIASPIAVTTYVALRAVFGAGRTTIQQLARVASVEVLKFKHRNDDNRAESLLTIFVLAAVFFGLTVGIFVVADNMRVLGLWLRHFDRKLFLEIALAFALTAPFFSYQIPMNLMFRTGNLAWVAKRHYLFVLCSGLLAGLALWASSLRLYLEFLVGAELLLSISFFLPGRERTVLSDLQAGKSGLLTAAFSSLLILICWTAVRHNFLGLYDAAHPGQMLLSYGMTVITIGSFTIVVSMQHREQFKAIPSLKKTNRPSLAVAK